MLRGILSMFEGISISDIMAIGSFLVTLGAYVYIRNATKPENIVQKVIDYGPDVVKALVEDETFQKSIYGAGVLIGNGASSGFGLQKSGGKMGWKDLIMNALGGMLGGQKSGENHGGNPFRPTT